MDQDDIFRFGKLKHIEDFISRIKGILQVLRCVNIGGKHLYFEK